jgi:hypothetical protein
MVDPMRIDDDPALGSLPEDLGERTTGTARNSKETGATPVSKFIISTQLASGKRTVGVAQGQELLDMARDLAAFNLPARVGSSLGPACSGGAGALIGGLPTAR